MKWLFIIVAVLIGFGIVIFNLSEMVDPGTKATVEILENEQFRY